MSEDNPPPHMEVMKELRVEVEDMMSETAVGGLDRQQERDIGQEVREVCSSFGRIISSEREKKRLTVAAIAELEAVKERFEVLLDRLRQDNSKLKGNLEENRLYLTELMSRKEARVEDTQRTEERIEKRVGGKSVRWIEEAVLEDTAVRRKDAKEPSKEKRTESKGGDKSGHLKEVRIEDRGQANLRRSERTGNKGEERREQRTERTGMEQREMSAVLRGDKRTYSGVAGTEGELGKGRKPNDERNEMVEDEDHPKAGAEDAVSRTEEVESRNEYAFRTVRNRKKRTVELEERRKESWRAKEPAKSFVVEVGDRDRATVRKGVWSEILKKVRAPQVTRTSTMARGDLRITPGDDRTAEALRELEREGKVGIREVNQSWPKVMIFDVDKEIKEEEIARTIRSQNSETGLEEGEECKGMKPLFKKGPREGDTTWWVCEVAPEVYKRIVRRRLFIGMMLCRIVEFVDVVQCRGCLGFGHMEAKCARKRIICGYCAKEGHRVQSCEKVGKPRCFNCGSGQPADHKDCKVRKSVTRATMVATNYGDSR